jgi:hypothetical protein
MTLLRIVAAAVATAALAVSAATAGTSSTIATLPVTGVAGDGVTFTGAMEVTGFAVQNGQVVALGTVSGTLTDAHGAVVGHLRDAAVAAPVQPQQGGCSIVSISIGAIDVSALGLVAVHLDPIVLNVQLEGLLGALLCPLLGGAAPPA